MKKVEEKKQEIQCRGCGPKQMTIAEAMVRNWKCPYCDSELVKPVDVKLQFIIFGLIAIFIFAYFLPTASLVIGVLVFILGISAFYPKTADLAQSALSLDKNNKWKYYGTLTKVFVISAAFFMAGYYNSEAPETPKEPNIKQTRNNTKVAKSAKKNSNIIKANDRQQAQTNEEQVNDTPESKGNLFVTEALNALKVGNVEKAMTEATYATDAEFNETNAKAKAEQIIAAIKTSSDVDAMTKYLTALSDEELERAGQSENLPKEFASEYEKLNEKTSALFKVQVAEVSKSRQEAKAKDLAEKEKLYAKVFPHTIIKKTSYNDLKLSLDVRLQGDNKEDRPTTEQLGTLANALYNHYNGTTYNKVFICYYLPGMKVDSGAWATSHFTPNMEIKIIGLTKSQNEAIRKVAAQPVDGELIGCWRDNESAFPGLIKFVKRNGKIFMYKTYSDGNTSERELATKRYKTLKQYYVKSNPNGDYWMIGKSGNLGWGDEEGIWAVSKKVDNGTLAKVNPDLKAETIGNDWPADTITPPHYKSLKKGSSYLIVGTIILMPVHPDEINNDALDQIQKMEKIVTGREGAVISIQQVRLSGKTPWYFVSVEEKSGWINSISLAGATITEE